ncbi:YciI family protein [Pseudoalteromonas xiamenensis]|uniref:YCII-related domain-containing protein n=1 Tax=Pseudoalteromonas xiamenensis TaxID=882626 RepID=A0A975HMV4_9GAMM|nr:YciI family protein [Pseudoalteromonas xiamenensis]QTH73508.1 hypothetical protein J5O05_18630 [Pseudoalteromonas xiamenensis]
MFFVDMTFTDVEQITPELTERHRAYLGKQYESGKLMFGGRKVPRSGGILISQHESKEDLTEILNADPFIQSGLVTYTITEFVPVMASQAYEHLVA